MVASLSKGRFFGIKAGFGLAVVFFAALIFIKPVPALAFVGGDGSTSTPFQISTCQDLQDIGSNLTAHYILTSDVDCSGTPSFMPIAAGAGQESGFAGELNGDNFTIHDVTVSSSTTEDLMGGIFDTTSPGANIHDLVIASSTFSGAFGEGGSQVGALAGEAFGGTFTNITVMSSVTVYADQAGKVGGLIGFASDDPSQGLTISNCSSSPAFILNDLTDPANNIGGLVGFVGSYNNSISITYSSSNSDLNFPGSNTSYVGGLIGWVENNASSTITIANSEATGNVSAEDNSGGLIGTLMMNTNTDMPDNAKASIVVRQDTALGNVLVVSPYSDNFDFDNFGGGLIGAVSVYATGTQDSLISVLNSSSRW
jgi:hypothetical protein